MKKIVFFLMLLTILTKTLGFLREITLSYYYGVSGITDAYLISLTIPSTIFAFIGIGLVTSYIPMYSSIIKDKSEIVASRFTNNLISIIMIISTIVVVIVVIFTFPIVKLFASGFSGETLRLSVLFTRIGIVSIYFSGLIFLFNGFLQIKNDFIGPAIVGIPLNLFIILSIIISANTNVIILSIGSALAVFIQFLFLLPILRRKGYKYNFVFDLKDSYIKKMIFLSIPVIIGISVNQINIIVDRTLASQIIVGGISALSYANRINLFIQGIFVMSVATVFYPTISKMVVENNKSKLIKTISEAININSLLILPATIGLMVFAMPIVSIIFGRGAFNTDAITMTSSALFFYAIGMVGYGFREILSRIFYAYKDTKTPMINAAIAVVMNIILNLLLSKYMGINGLALATSISAIFCTVLLFISLRKKISSFSIKNISISFVKILCASLIMGVISKLFYNLFLFFINKNLSLIFSIVIGFATYLLIIYFMKIDDVRVIMNAVKGKIKRSGK